ncbi:hypothetical protein HK100_006270 [Physocladia obscura]|uniref:Uncharacterized protein n=1 Tax=Physocladia obscura TaxID=109957 RepID=A0AAD5XKE6_9FUNG|nr:hypothetical protein HK100_006270 [Physocladia obscura]
MITLRDFALLRKSADSHDFEEPSSWRDLYQTTKKEREDQLLRVKKRMTQSNKVIEQEKEKSSIKILEKSVVPFKPKWGSAFSNPKAPVNRLGRAINAVKKEMRIKGTFNYNPVAPKPIASKSVPMIPSRPKPMHPDVARSTVKPGVKLLPMAKPTIMTNAANSNKSNKPFSLVLPE